MECRDADPRHRKQTAAPPDCPATTGSRAPAVEASSERRRRRSRWVGKLTRILHCGLRDVAPARRQARRPAASTPPRRRWRRVVPASPRSSCRAPPRPRARSDPEASPPVNARDNDNALEGEQNETASTVPPATAVARRLERFDRHRDGTVRTGAATRRPRRPPPPSKYRTGRRPTAARSDACRPVQPASTREGLQQFRAAPARADHRGRPTPTRSRRRQCRARLRRCRHAR